MTFSTRNFDPLTPLAPKFPNFATQILLFAWNTLLPSPHMQMCYKIFYTTWVRVLLAKNNVQDQNWRVTGLGEHSKNLGPPMYFCNRWSYQIAFGTSLPKMTFRTKIGGVWARGASEKNGDPLRICANIEASNFKFGTQIGFGTSLTKNDV